MPAVQYDTVTFSGGLDLVTPTYNLPPGALRDGVNFAPLPLGGYYRISGYERYSGQPAPSAAEVSVMKASWFGVRPVVGDVVFIDQHTGVVCSTGFDYVAITKYHGSADLAGPTDIIVNGVIYGTSTGLYGGIPPRMSAELRSAAANIYRSDIAPVPGSGPIRGCITYKGLAYAFRDNADGTACDLYKSSATGWTLVNTGVSLLPGGRYEMTIATFTTGADSQKIYGCDGVNDPFQFDGVTFTQITGVGVSAKPNHIAAFKGHLFLTYGTSAVHSALGDPMNYQVIDGGGEIGTSDIITGLLVQPGTGQGGALAIYGRNTIYMLYGSSSADWNFVTFGIGVGGMEFTMQNLSDSYSLDDRGVIAMKTSLNYGNFDTSSITYNIKSVIAENRNLAVASSVNREHSQYRIFFSNGYGVFSTIANSELVGHGVVQYPDALTCAWDGETADGRAMSIFGTASGHVMQNDIGTSFDGANISAYMVTNVNTAKTPRLHKRYRRCVLEVQGTDYAAFSVGYNFDWASSDILQHAFSDAGVDLAKKSKWDSFHWDNFYWDGRVVAPSHIELNGSGENIQLIISLDADSVSEFALSSAIFHYTLRRGKR